MTRPLEPPDLFHARIRAACLREARRYVGAADAQDVVQEALLRAWRHRHRCRTPARPLPWLLAITRREALRRRRASGASLADAAEHRDPAADDELVRAAVRVDAVRALRRLSAPERRLVALRYLLDWTHQDLADHFGISEVAVRVRLHRARRRLRALMT